MSALVDAIERLTRQPETLTRADVAVITKADPALGERARAARATAAAEVLADRTATAIKQVLAPLSAANRTLTEQVTALEQRVLELEAQAASRDEVTP